MSSSTFLWDTPTLILSDLHISGAPKDQNLIDMLLYLTDPQRSEELPFKQIVRIVFLGDVFDFQLGFSTSLYRAHLPFYYCLRKLLERNVELIYFTGNHDPEAHPVLFEDLNISVLNGPTLVTLYDERVLLEHGDLLEPNLIKKLLCKVVRTPWICKVARLIPSSILWYLTQAWSNKQDPQEGMEKTVLEYDPADLLKMIQKTWPKVRKQNIAYWVFGHFHQALAWAPQNNTLCPLSVLEMSKMIIEPSETIKDEKTTINQDTPKVFVTGDQVRLNTLLYWGEKGPQLLKVNY